MLPRTLCCALAFASIACGEGDYVPPPDSAPVVTYAQFDSMTWSVSYANNATQISVSDALGASACGLSGDHTNSLGAAGQAVILTVPNMPSVCAPGSYPLTANCALALGAGPFVPANCAYYRKWDAQGAQLGLLSARNGEVTFAGTPASCSIRVNLGFVGGNFAELTTLAVDTATQPWCE